MSFPKAWWAGVIVLTALAALSAFQRPFRVYPSLEPYDNVALPDDWQEKSGVGLRPFDVSAASPGALCALSAGLSQEGGCDRRPHQLDSGLSASGPPSGAGRAALNPYTSPLRGATRESG